MSDPKPATTQYEVPAESAPEALPAGSQAASTQPAAATVLALIALLLCSGLAVAAYFTWNQLQQLVGQQAGLEAGVDDQLQPVRSSLRQLSDQAQRHREQVDKQLRELVQVQQAVDHRLSLLGTLVGRSEQGWSLSEVQYLLRIANQRLLLQRDLDTAKVALRSADGRLRELADPLYLAVREEIARELEALEAVPAVDREGINAGLTVWLERIGDLPVAGTDYRPTDRTVARAEPEKTVSHWSELPGLVWAAISDLFRLRHHEQPVTPMLPPEREYFLRENLRLQLAAARLALLRDDAVQFQGALETARDWLAAHFARDSAAVAALGAQLEKFAALDIRPDLPDISGSLSVLHQQMKLGEQQSPAAPLPQSRAGDVPSSTQQEAGGAAAP